MSSPPGLPPLSERQARCRRSHDGTGGEPECYVGRCGGERHGAPRGARSAVPPRSVAWARTARILRASRWPPTVVAPTGWAATSRSSSTPSPSGTHSTTGPGRRPERTTNGEGATGLPEPQRRVPRPSVRGRDGLPDAPEQGREGRRRHRRHGAHRHHHRRRRHVPRRWRGRAGSAASTWARRARAARGRPGRPPAESEFYEAVFDDVQNTWIRIFDAAGQEYREASLVIFEDVVDTGGCGRATEAVGPFYCPADERAYFDPDFFDQLASRFGAPGDFAQAYVVAHEVAHHVQNVTGVSGEVRQRQQGKSQARGERPVDPPRAPGRLSRRRVGVRGQPPAPRPSTATTTCCTWRRVTSARASRRPRRWATTTSRSPSAPRSTPTTGTTDRPTSARPGSRWAWRRATPAQCQGTFDFDVPATQIMPG